MGQTTSSEFPGGYSWRRQRQEFGNRYGKPNKRKPIPPSIKDAVLMEAGYKCANPRCHIILAPNVLEDHHIKYVSEGGGNELSNLLALCPLCHTLHHSGVISQEPIQQWKGMIVALNHALGHRSMDFSSLATDRRPTYSLLYGRRGLAIRRAYRCWASLFPVAVSGFVQSAATSYHYVYLSPKGRLLVEAWLAGDEEKYREAMNKSV